MNTINSHREALKWAVELLEMVMADVTDEQAHWLPPGLANPLGATYVHAVCALDGVINSLLQGQETLFATSWAGKTGSSDPQWAIEFEWARSLRVNLPQTKQFAQAVYAAADAYLASLNDEDLTREIDLSSMGLEPKSVNWILNALACGHVNNMAGEISVLKGIQGSKGYPF